MDAICVIRENINKYTEKETMFRPSVNYPEYLFCDEINKQENIVYHMIREGFIRLKLDTENIGRQAWNPLGGFIKPGNNVLIKPNLVLHENRSGCGIDCLYTNPSLVAAMIDYIIIALKGKGKIVVGDAPLQECEFQTLIQQSGYDILINYYKKKGIDIELVDFRNIKTYEKDGLHFLQEEEGMNGIEVKLDSNSTFADVSEERMKNLRITNYDPRILQQHHHNKTHEYNVSKHVLDADVIINMPKPKTHRKAGVTISLKNLVGINTNKEYLPHHTLGSKEEGGDAYLHKSSLLKMANEVLDIRNKLVHDGEISLARKAETLYSELILNGKKESNEKYWEGSWYGNDTIWRTTIDLNRILLYADKNGKMSNKKQRKLFIVGDMIVSGEKEGPLEPTPICPRTIIMGDDPLKFDRVVCSLMGFDYHDIPTLYNSELLDSDYPITDDREVNIISNYENWNGKSMDEIREHYSLEFQPSSGWIVKLGNKYRDKLFHELMKSGYSVYIFGAGDNGISAAKELEAYGIKVAAFCDNNSILWGTEIVMGIKCVKLDDANKENPFIIAAKEKFVSEITNQIVISGGKVWGVINN